MSDSYTIWLSYLQVTADKILQDQNTLFGAQVGYTVVSGASDWKHL
jgi:hypothetical protein